MEPQVSSPRPTAATVGATVGDRVLAGAAFIVAGLLQLVPGGGPGRALAGLLASALVIVGLLLLARLLRPVSRVSAVALVVAAAIGVVELLGSRVPTDAAQVLSTAGTVRGWALGLGDLVGVAALCVAAVATVLAVRRERRSHSAGPAHPAVPGVGLAGAGLAGVGAALVVLAAAQVVVRLQSVVLGLVPALLAPDVNRATAVGLMVVGVLYELATVAAGVALVWPWLAPYVARARSGAARARQKWVDSTP